MLSDVAIRKAAPAGKPYKMADEKGLYLLVRPAGGKLWHMKYRIAGKEKKLSFGPYPDVTLAEARDLRDAARKLIQSGIDPAEDKKRQAVAARMAQANSFEVVAREWFGLQEARWTPIHANDVLRSLERDVFPAIGPRAISAIDAQDVLGLLRKVERRGSIETAKRLRQRISAVFTLALSKRLVRDNPAKDLEDALLPKRKAKKQAAIVKLDDLRALIESVEQAGAYPVTLLASRFLALTAQRPGVVRRARWHDIKGIDWQSDEPSPDAIWHIPAAQMKLELDRKADDGFDHIVPLAPQAVDALRVVRQLSGRGDLVFPGQRHAHHPISENAIGYLYNRAGYAGRHVPHGWRAAFSTTMNERYEREWRAAGHRDASPDRAIIDLMLAHVPANKVEGAYNRAAYLPRRREIACEWADMLLASAVPAELLLDVERRSNPVSAARRRERAAYLDDAKAVAIGHLPGKPHMAMSSILSALDSWDGGTVLNAHATRALKAALLDAVLRDDSNGVKVLIDGVE
ncbi:DUF4102 domain-containing protein [Novosphingobium sp. NBM11]|uniref:tyrosine-type recombinase/integrase n=1 Tax=Novosphingobium sp. NBM11 TaxID=2596914 RepID=UPI0018928391|nr:integrase arm-type DNA-binding domain-containing protein [Novosphingobium sp. NBM11]MBF5091896.1 DUF4102 domain-containing protein [Novosphingobium sp. NBM11]